MPDAESHDGRPGRTPLSFAAIADAAIRLADHGGMHAVSMRKVAAELGSGTMSLYRYVANKEQLYALMCDTVLAAEPAPARSGDWRADLRALAESERAVYRRHPWMLDSISPLGPGGIARVENSLALLAPTGLAMDDIVGVLGMVSSTVHAAIRHEMSVADLHRSTGMDVHEWHAAHSGDIKGLQGGEFPMVARMIAETGRVDHDAAFHRSLAIVLDGVAALIARTGAG
ncbi:TetR family transcriptional regulator [Murinocardiopsis flavida]|uniref:TetR family transcriptional regulator n=1 Tax=Murinocardiopsis flavida TaxID=645275 RepID=A0A2P8DS97_9ACTN|nr:TetR/AcrR family transcriptional regulator [Murinocardiopsis flavida]PSL00087.1 TetR family transcriptional regulator [Murinocardiopsis flavida]